MAFLPPNPNQEPFGLNPFTTRISNPQQPNPKIGTNPPALKSNGGPTKPPTTTTTTTTNITTTSPSSLLYNPDHHSTICSPPSDQTQYYASIFTRRRLTPTVLLPPTLLLLLPPILFQLAVVTQYITGGNAILTTFITILICRAIYGNINRYAPTREKYELALDQCRYRLELFVWVGVVLMVRLMMAVVVGGRLEGMVMWKDWGDWEGVAEWLGFSWIGVGRIALGALVLSWMVTMRFIGRGGIAQCSPFPLPSNPYNGMIKSAVSLMKAPDTIIDTLVSSGGSTRPNSATVSATTPPKAADIRYNRPDLTTIATQIMFHALGGYLYFYSTTDTIVGNGLDQTTVGGITMICCILLSVATLFTSYVIHTSKILPHELSIRGGSGSKTTTTNYPIFNYLKVQEELMAKLRQSKLLFVWMFTPILVSMIVVAHTIGSTAAGRVDLLPLVQDLIQILLLSTYPKTLFIITYTVILDIVVRMTLVAKGVDIGHLLLAKKKHHYNNNNGNNEEFTVEDLIMQSTLAGFGTGIVENVVATHSPAVRNDRQSVFLGSAIQVVDLEEKEIERYKATKGCVANAIETGLVSGCTSLEDDLLRMHILESLGGTIDEEVENEGSSMTKLQMKETEVPEKKSDSVILKGDNNLALGLSLQHYHTLKRIPRGQAVAPVVRALCAYAGGLGEALQRCTAKSSSAESKTWSFPPCASESAEYAIVGAARLVALALLDNPSGNVRRNHNRISPLVLVVLQSAHQLRCGLLEYAKYVMHFEGERSYVGKEGTYRTSTIEGMNNLCKYISVHYSDISHILEACDKAARQIMQVINDLSIANISKDCNAWLKSLQQNNKLVVRR